MLWLFEYYFCLVDVFKFLLLIIVISQIMFCLVIMILYLQIWNILDLTYRLPSKSKSHTHTVQWKTKSIFMVSQSHLNYGKKFCRVMIRWKNIYFTLSSFSWGVVALIIESRNENWIFSKIGFLTDQALVCLGVRIGLMQN